MASRGQQTHFEKLFLAPKRQKSFFIQSLFFFFQKCVFSIDIDYLKLWTFLFNLYTCIVTSEFVDLLKKYDIYVPLLFVTNI